MLSWYAHQHLIPSQPRLTDTCNEQVPTSFPCSFCMFVPQKLSLYSNTEKPNSRTTLLHYLIIRYKLQVTNDYFLSMSFSLAVVCRIVCWWKMCSNYLSNIRTFKLWCKKKIIPEKTGRSGLTQHPDLFFISPPGLGFHTYGSEASPRHMEPCLKTGQVSSSYISEVMLLKLWFNLCLFFLNFETKMLVECPR